MPVVSGIRAADLPDFGDIDRLRLALLHGREDGTLQHAAAGEVAQTPMGLAPGVNLFGPGHSPAMTFSAKSMTRTREVTSVLLHDAAFVASSMTVIDRRMRLFLDAIDNMASPDVLAGFDPHFEIDEQGRLRLKEDFLPRAEHVDCIALPVCGLGFPNYGHFLFDGLPAAYLLAQILPDVKLRIVGQRLAPWQEAILSALGLRERYLEVRAPIVFRRVLASTLMAMHVSYPTAFVRPLFDTLRFRFAGSVGTARRVFMTRSGFDTRRRLRNREAVEAAMTELGFLVVRPDLLSFAEQAAIIGGADFVVGESGAAMANIGFCRPGTKVLELQPERFVEGWTRGMCMVFGHRWHVYFAQVDSEPLTDATGQPLDPSQHFAFDIDPRDLGDTIRAIDAA